MRLTALTILVGAALAAFSVSSSAARHGYISQPMGFGFLEPGEIKVEKSTYNSALAGQHESTVYHSLEDNIEYKVTVVDMGNDANDAANLVGEAEYNFQDGKKVLMDVFGRACSGDRRRFCRLTAITTPRMPAGSLTRSLFSRCARRTMPTSCRHRPNSGTGY